VLVELKFLACRRHS